MEESVIFNPEKFVVGDLGLKDRKLDDGVINIATDKMGPKKIFF